MGESVKKYRLSGVYLITKYYFLLGLMKDEKEATRFKLRVFLEILGKWNIQNAFKVMQLSFPRRSE